MNIAALIVIDVQKGFDDPRWGSRNRSLAGLKDVMPRETSDRLGT